MVFGSRESGFIFCYLASLIVWYLNAIQGRARHRLILDILHHLGIPLNASDSHLGQRVPHLGFILVSTLMTVSIPEPRRKKYAILHAAVGRTSIPRSLLYWNP